MLRFALCDDEHEDLVLIEQMIEEYSREHPELNISISTFNGGALLLEHLRLKGSFDVYLLDVLLPGKNGIELGIKIRECDKQGKILYLTSSRSHAVDSYLVKASGYLVKPPDKNSLVAALDDVVESWLEDSRLFITFKTRSGIRRLELNSIVYGELVGHCVHYHLADGSTIQGMSLRKSFKDAVSNLLEHDRFVMCAASFVVNLSYIEKIEMSDLTLTEGVTIPMSRTYRAEVTNQWLDYHLKGGNRK